MRGTRAVRRRLGVAALAGGVMVAGGCGWVREARGASAGGDGAAAGAFGADTGGEMALGVNGAMAAEMPMPSSHMRMSPRWAPAPGDSARAMRVEEEVARAIARYADVKAALADGYRPFHPEIPQREYHFTKPGNALLAAFAFDPSRPTSLLYRRSASGGWELVGAMLTAPYRASPEELNARYPLSMGTWHLHTNICLPPSGRRDLWRARRDGQPLFGPRGTIATESACAAEGGRWHGHVFGWMIHLTQGAGSRKQGSGSGREQ